MRIKNIQSSILFVIAFSIFAHAQTSKVSPKLIVQKVNLASKDFVEGKTVIAEVKFTGLDSDYESYENEAGNPVRESHFLILLRENQTSISDGEKFNSVKIEKVIKLLKAEFAEHGYLKAEIVALGEKLPNNQMRLIFSVKRGAVVRVSEIRFTGNKNITSEEFVENFKNCSGDRWEIFDRRIYDYYARECSRGLMLSKGFFEAKLHVMPPRMVSDSYIVTVELKEGIRYRIGEIKVTGAKFFTEKEILEMTDLNTGDVADGSKLVDFIYEKLKKTYGDKGFCMYNAEFEPKFIAPQAEGLDGTVDIFIDIDEGRQFRLANIRFDGIEPEKSRELRNLISLNDGEIFNQSQLEDDVKKIDETKSFYPIDIDKDVDVKTDEEKGQVYIVILLHKVQ